MPFKQSWKEIAVDGGPVIPWHEWFATLPVDQQQIYAQAQQRQFEYRQEAIDRGDMILDSDGNYVWKDAATAALGKHQDEVWADYHKRYHRECGIKVICIEEEK